MHAGRRKHHGGGAGALGLLSAPALLIPTADPAFATPLPETPPAVVVGPVGVLDGAPRPTAAALLFRDDAGAGESTHLAFVSSYNCFTILLAESSDGREWSIANSTWMQGRPGCWDACGVIAGAQPERLSSGDYFLLYNIDTEASGRGNRTAPLGRCTIGWAILDGKDPRQVVARAESALVTPTMPWDTTRCNGKETTDTCQTPNVIFATGLKPLGNDAFLVIYGGGDTDTATIKIQVTISLPLPLVLATRNLARVAS